MKRKIFGSLVRRPIRISSIKQAPVSQTTIHCRSYHVLQSIYVLRKEPYFPKRFSSTISSPTYKVPLKTSIILGDVYSQVDKLIRDPIKRNRFIKVIGQAKSFSESEIVVISSNFENLIDIINGYPDPEAIGLLMEIWDVILTNDSKDASISELTSYILETRSKIIHILINTRNFHLYEKSIAPILKDSRFKHERDWNDRLITTFQLKYDENGKLSLNRNLIAKYLRNPDHPIESRRKLLSHLVHTGITNASDTEEKYLFTSYFIEFSKILQDDHMLFTKPEFQAYTSISRLMATSRQPILQHFERLVSIFNSAELDELSLYDFMTSAMVALQLSSPNTVLNIWRYKIDTINLKNLPLSRYISPTDLKSAMNALCSLNLFQEVLELYRSYPELHSEDQIEVLLRVSEESKDWKLLQSQFEDMYGKGQLPYVIHYSIVMKALALIGAKKEVDKLFIQLNKRKLTPTPSIFAALISSRLYENDTKGAMDCFQVYLDFVERGIVNSTNSAHLYGLVFKIYYKSSDLGAAMKFLDETIAQQKLSNIQLIGPTILKDLIDFASLNFGLSELERIRALVLEMELDSVEVHKRLIRAYVRLDQFEIAEKLVYEAHLMSYKPFTDAEVYAAQLRLYRYWIRSIPSPSKKHALRLRQKFISKLVLLEGHHIISIEKNSLLMQEIIENYVSRNQIDNAYEAFKIAKEKEVLSEKHFLPLFRHSIRLNTYASHGQVLKLYRRMVDQRVETSTKTYVYLIQALIYLDSKSNNNFENAFKLLKSIFSMNGLTLNTSEPSLKASQSAVFDNAVDMCRIVSLYVTASSDQQNNIDILVHFLHQMKEILGPRLRNEFRYTIYKTMAGIYQNQGKSDLAEKLVTSGLKDLEAQIQKFNSVYPFTHVEETRIPRALEKEYRTLVNAKLLCLKASRNMENCREILEHSLQDHIRLGGQQYNRLIKEELRDFNESQKNEPNLHLVLTACEEHLISGNWVEVKLMRKLQFMYKLVMLHLSNGDQSILEKYDILNQFYNVHSVKQLREELVGIQDPLATFETEFYIHKPQLTSERWKSHQVLWDIPGFFIPEKRIDSQNVLSPSNTSKLWLAVHKYCDGDRNRAFKLMDQYPETVEFLLYNDVARRRVMKFRRRIDKIIAPRNDSQETFQERRTRTLQALTNLQDEQTNQTFEQYTVGSKPRFDRY